jgi:sugar lactone lactonase YvrE
MSENLKTVATNLAFPEGPRWHDGTLWWSDMHGGNVCRLVDGKTETVCSVGQRPSGLGWLPDGRMLVVSMLDKRVLRLEENGTLGVHADLSALAPRRCNDMVVDSKGGAFVGNFGFDEEAGEKPCGTVLIRVEADGAARIVADDLVFPNGMVITDGGKTLVVAETYAARLTAFDIDETGNLSNRRAWASFAGTVYPDGICLDQDGASISR